MTYADNPNYGIRLDNSLPKHMFIDNVLKIPYNKGNTYTGKALSYAADTVFQTSGGMRDPELGFARVILLITDGRSQDYISAAVTKLKERGVIIYGRVDFLLSFL